MRRNVSYLDFALVWGKVSRWPDKEWSDLVALRTAADAAKAEDKPARKARKAKGVKPEGGAS